VQGALSERPDGITSADMAAYMRWWRSAFQVRKRALNRPLKDRPVASHRPLPDKDRREGHCIFCGHRTVAVDDVCSMCRRELEG